MKSVRILALILAMAFALGVSSSAWANTGAATGLANATVTPEPTETPEPDEDASRVAQAIADEFQVDVEEIIALHKEGLGFGEIVKAYALARETGKTVEEILAMKEKGMGWGEIAQALEVKPGNWEPNLGELVRDSKNKEKGNPHETTAGHSGKDKDNHGKDNGKGKNK